MYFPRSVRTAQPKQDIEAVSKDNCKRKAREYPVPDFSMDRRGQCEREDRKLPRSYKAKGSRVRPQTLLWRETCRQHRSCKGSWHRQKKDHRVGGPRARSNSNLSSTAVNALANLGAWVPGLRARLRKWSPSCVPG